MNYIFFSYLSSLISTSNPFFVVLIVLIIALFILIIICTLLVILFPRMSQKPKVDNNIRIYSYDYSRKLFTYFDKMNLKKQRTLSEKAFLDQFKASDRYRVQDWLKDISQGKKINEFIQADIKINTKNHYVTSMIELTGFNPDACVIHFESHLLPFATFKTKTGGLFAKKRFVLSDKNTASDFLEEGDPNSLGAFYFIKIYHLDKENLNDDEVAVAELNKEIIDLLRHYTNNKRKLYLYSETEEIIIDNASMSKIATMEMAHTIATAIQQHLNFKAPNSNLSVAIGITLSSFYNKNFDDAVTQSLSMVDAIIHDIVPNKIALFDPQFYKRHKQKIDQTEQVKSIIKNNTIRLYFTPTLDVSKQQQAFYLLNPIPYGTDLHTFYDILKISAGINGGSDLLFTSLFDQIAQITSSKSVELMIKIPYSLASSFLNVSKQQLNSYIKWIICFEESDLITYIDDLQSIKNIFEAYTNKGIKLALELSTISSLLPGKVNTKFSYFIIGKKFTQGSANKDPNINELRVIQSEYSCFPGKFVYTYLKDIDDIEICAHYSGEIFQCDEIGLPSSRLENIDTESISDIMQITK